MTDPPFSIGDTVRFAMLPEPLSSQLAVEVLDIGVCDEDGCGKYTVHYTDPEVDLPDEAHVEDFVLVKQAT